jgi:hypothetical protein
VQDFTGFLWLQMDKRVRLTLQSLQDFQISFLGSLVAAIFLSSQVVLAFSVGSERVFD